MTDNTPPQDPQFYLDEATRKLQTVRSARPDDPLVLPHLLAALANATVAGALIASGRPPITITEAEPVVHLLSYFDVHAAITYCGVPGTAEDYLRGGNWSSLRKGATCPACLKAADL